MEQETFQQIVQTIPLDPGIYKYFDARKGIALCGKGKKSAQKSQFLF